jgi:outer membrane protein assembly factor BamE (lipoprotein component of BamABCDE complex)
MWTHRFLLLMILLLFITQGCVLGRARVGTPISEEGVTAIEKGVSSKEVVVSLLGAPDSITVGNDKEIFHYVYYDAKSPSLFLMIINIFSLNVKSDNLYVFFNKQDIVQDVIYGKRTDGVRFTLRPWGR